MTEPSPPPLSRAAAGVVLKPGPLFDELSGTPPERAYWLVPLALYILVAVACTQLLVTLPGPAAELRRLAEHDLFPRLEEYARDGTMTRGQTEWLRLFITPGTGQFFFTQLAGTALTAIGALVFGALILWQLARSVLARALRYTKVLELAGLAFVIGILERLASTALVAATGSLLATPGPGLFLLSAPESNLFLILSSVNVFTLWEIGVAGTGLAHFCGRDVAKVMVLLYALWFLWTAAMLLPVFFA